MSFGISTRVKGNKNPCEKKNKPSSAPRFTVSDMLADPFESFRQVLCVSS
jgi:hypothetical protein